MKSKILFISFLFLIFFHTTYCKEKASLTIEDQTKIATYAKYEYVKDKEKSTWEGQDFKENKIEIPFKNKKKNLSHMEIVWEDEKMGHWFLIIEIFKKENQIIINNVYQEKLKIEAKWGKETEGPQEVTLKLELPFKKAKSNTKISKIIITKEKK